MLDYADDQELAAVPIHRSSSPHYGILDDNTYFPANHNQLRDLLGKLLNVLDAMGLSDRAHKATKALIVAEVWRWWGGVYENATTSGRGCVAPVVMFRTGWLAGEPEPSGPPSNRWGFASEAEYLAGAAS